MKGIKALVIKLDQDSPKTPSQIGYASMTAATVPDAQVDVLKRSDSEVRRRSLMKQLGRRTIEK